MTILFDYQIFQRQTIGGISRVYCETIAHLMKIANCTLGVKRSNNIHLKESGLFNKLLPLKDSFLGMPSSLKYPGSRTINHLFNPIYDNYNYSIKLLKEQNYDIFEPTYYDSYFLKYLKGKPFTLEIHDMIPELLTNQFPADDFQITQKQLLCPLATHIHTPSLKTKEDLVNILNINPEKITVIPHGYTELPPPQNERPINNPYILFVGNRVGYKNFSKTLQEFSIISQKLQDIHLICTGTPFTSDELLDIHNYGLEDKIHHLYASETILSTLYHFAKAFVFPSSYEGFGLPILEAFSCGCPVLLNNASCFPEVGGDAAIYFDINRRGELAEQIVSLLQVPQETRTSLISKGKERLKLFSWEKSAEQLKNIYENIL